MKLKMEVACHDVEEDSQHFHDFVIARVVNGRFAGGGHVGFGCRFATRGALDGISAAGASRDVCAAGHICSVAEVDVKQQPERDQDQECCAKETPRAGILETWRRGFLVMSANDV
uniref:Cytomegalovirus DNA for mtrIII region n=1 Tax=Human cytomegalovirus TaxID=10359 RepID=Q68829_HCMV|nr:unnamed protein product [Human betaherpesvirus 5]